MDSLPKTLKNIDRQVYSILRTVDVLGLDRAPRELLTKFQLRMDEAQRYAKDYDAAEFWNEKEDAASALSERVEQLNQYLLDLSSYDLFGPTDVAQMSAQFDAIRSKLA